MARFHASYDDFEVYLETEGTSKRKVIPDVIKQVALYDNEIYKIVVNNKFGLRIKANINLSGSDIGTLILKPHQTVRIERPIRDDLPPRKFQFVKFGGKLANELSATPDKPNADEIQIVIEPEIPKPDVHKVHYIAAASDEATEEDEESRDGLNQDAIQSDWGGDTKGSSNKGTRKGIKVARDFVDGSSKKSLEASSNKGCSILSSIESNQKWVECENFKTKGTFYYVMFLREAIQKPMKIDDSYGYVE